MNAKKFELMLEKYIKKKAIVKIYRMVNDGETNITGFILAKSSDFLLIQNEEEFYLNGYSIIRKDSFDSIRCSKLEKTLKKILKEEGVLKKMHGIKKELALKSWEGIFKALMKDDFHVIVECENLKKPLFVIGEIIKVTGKTVSIRYYNAVGVLDKKPTLIKLKDITLLRFGDRYSTIFRKYLKENK